MTIRSFIQRGEVTLDDVLQLARTLYIEARGEGEHGMKAVAHTILNRVERQDGQFARDDTISGAVQRHLQFSGWNSNDPNFRKAFTLNVTEALFRAALRAALEAMDESDFTHEATHYHASSIKPDWAVGHQPCFTHGRHMFYNDVR